MRWLKKNWWIVVAAIAAYMFRDKIKGMFGGTNNDVPGSEKSVQIDGDNDYENIA